MDNEQPMSLEARNARAIGVYCTVVAVIFGLNLTLPGHRDLAHVTLAALSMLCAILKWANYRKLTRPPAVEAVEVQTFGLRS